MPETPSESENRLSRIDAEALAKRIAEALAGSDPASISEALREAFAAMDSASLPIETLRTALAEGEIQRIFQEEARRSAEVALQSQIDPKLDKMRDDIKRGIERASGDILAQVKGSIEGRIVAAVSIATSTKEFREVLREVTLWSAKQAVKDAGQPFIEEMKQSAEATLKEGLKTAMQNAQGSLDPAIEEHLEKRFSSQDFGALVSALVKPMVDQAVAAVLGGETAGGLRELVTASVREETKGSFDRIDETLAGLMASISGTVESALGEVQGRLDEIEGESLRKLYEILQGLSSPEDLDERIRRVSAEGSEKLVKAMKSALDEISKRVSSLIEKERERTKKLIEESASPAPAGAAAAPPADLDDRIKTVALKSLEESGLPPEAVKALFEMMAFQNKVVALAATDRRSAKDETLQMVKETVKASLGSSTGLSDQAVKQAVSEEVASALSSAKSLVKKLQPIIESEAGKAVREKMGAVPSLEELQTALEAKAEHLKTELLMSSGRPSKVDPEALRELVAEALKAKLDALVEDLVQKKFNSALESSEAIQKIVRSALDKDVLRESVDGVMQSDLFTGFINSDHLKELLDDKFKIMRNWLRNEELPRLIRKAGEPEG